MKTNIHPHHQRFSTQLIFTTAIGFILLMETIGTVFYMLAEGWSFIDSIYFTTTTLTTIGFGDHVPTQDLSKLFTVIFSFAGVGTVLFSITLVSEYYFRHKMVQIANLESKIHQMMTPKEVEKKAKEVKKEEKKLKKKEERLRKEEKTLKEEEKKVEKEEKKLKKIIQKI